MELGSCTLSLSLSLLPFTGAGVAGASSSRPVAQRVQAATAIVHGTVLASAGCASTGDAHAWTFVELQVQHVLLGSLIPAAGQPADRFTVRLKGGTHPNGAHSGLLGTPNLAVGDEVVVLLRYQADGDPVVAPIPSGGNVAVWNRQIEVLGELPFCSCGAVGARGAWTALVGLALLALRRRP